MEQEFLYLKITEFARRFPHKIAIKNENQSFSYLDLEKKSNRIANFMNGKIKHIPNVIIILDRSPELIESIIGLLKCGLVFVPLAPEFPGDRIRQMVNETQSEWAITNNKYYEKFKNIFQPNHGANPANKANLKIKTLIIDEKNISIDYHDHTFYLDPDIECNELVFERVFNKNCYIYFTSGSTGIPKGVLGRHNSLVQFIQWEINEFRVNEQFYVSQLTPPSFDPFLRDIFVPLMAGGTLCIPSHDTLMNMKKLIQWIDENNIFLIHTVPSLFKQLVPEIKDSNCFHDLKYILLAGELLRGRDISKFIELFNHRIQLVNVYGPTETTLAKLFYRIQPADVNRSVIPVGKPIDGAQVLILDSNKQICRKSMKGEIYIRTPFRSSGYYNDPQLTEKVFIKNPYGKHPKDIIYKSGDLGRILREGNIELLGRVDSQVKIRGARVELGEIENRLLNYNNIKEAVVIANDDENGDKYLSAYLVAMPGKTLDSSTLREYLSSYLPDYMLPSYFVFLDKIPLTISGKTDRARMPDARKFGVKAQMEISYLAPRDILEERITDIWAEVLQLEKIGVNHNFFDLGGNSLKIMEVNSKLSKEFQKEIPVIKLYEHPTISSLAAYLKELEANKHQDKLSQEGTGIGKASKKIKEIAVIGMSCRFPGAKNIEEFWQNLKQGKETIGFFSDEALLNSNMEPGLFNNPNYVKAASVLEDKDLFDASFFGYTTKEAELLDPQIRLFHECTWEALEDSGIVPDRYDGLIGVYAGAVQNPDWEIRAVLSGKSRSLGEFVASKLTGIRYLCTRLSYNLDLKGPSVTIQTACSTSLVAIHMACQAILNGECDAAIAGGVSVSPEKKFGYIYEKDMIYSSDGHCRSFDEKGDGTIFGEGAGVVVLKSLENSIVEGDNIYAVIKGSAINNDGSRKVGFTAPSVGGQVDVIRSALFNSGIEPESISYVEAHGTATTLGDPIELEALTQVFNTDKIRFCKIGSVKSNFGHLDAAAGVAGFIKAVLSLKHRMIPPSLHFITPNPVINFNNSPFEVNTQLMEWKRKNYPMRAAINSVGMGGTNAHVILQEAPSVEHSGQLPGLKNNYQLIPISAKTKSALEKLTDNLAQYFRKNPHINLANAAYTLQLGRKAFQYRRMLVCPDVNQAIEALSFPNSKKLNIFQAKKREKSIIFMFSGLGSQYVNMTLGLYQTEKVFREEMDRCFEILKSFLGYDIKKILYPGDSVSKKSMKCEASRETLAANNMHWSTDINQTQNSQIVIFILEYALAKLLMRWGIKPHAMIGYSFGEYVAACISDVFSLENALELIAFRGELINRTPAGAMLSVPLSKQELKPLLSDELSIAIDNGPSCIISGPGKAVDTFERQMKEKKYICMRLQSSYALHSKIMAPILEEFKQKAAELHLKKPQIPYISGVTGKWITANETTDPGYLARHLSESVQFAVGIKELAHLPNAVFVEIGPGRDLSALVVRHIENKPDLKSLHLVRHPEQKISDEYFLLKKIGLLWLWGVKIDWKEFHAGKNRQRISLPPYPFYRQRYWIECDSFNVDAWSTKAIEANTRICKKKDIADRFHVQSWKQTIVSMDKTNNIPTQWYWLLFIDNCGLGSLLAEELKKREQQVITVKMGEAFKKESNWEFTINHKTHRENHYEALFARLVQSGRTPDKIVHLWGITAPNHFYKGLEIEGAAETQNLGFNSLLNIAQASGRNNPGKTMEITVVTNNMQEVNGEDGLCPGKATVLGPIKSIPFEYAKIKCRSIDVVLSKPGSSQEKKLVEQLFCELTGEWFDPVVAYRSHYRWIQQFEPIQLKNPIGKNPRLKEKGVYLVTGGLAGMGFLLAKYLAKTVGAKLVLTDCHAIPPKEQWHQLPTEENQENRLAGNIRKIKTLEELGADVLVFGADPTNEEQMQTVINKTLEKFGHINGVIHSQGLTQSEPLRKTTPETAGTFLESNIKGTLILDKILKDNQPDFFVLYSSLSSIPGESGYVEHSAACNFLDAFAKYKFFNEGILTFSINWNRYQIQGTTTISEHIPDTLTQTHQELSGEIPFEQVKETFNRILKATMPQVVISARDPRGQIKHANSVEATFQKKKLEETDLPDLLAKRSELETEYAAPTNDTEQILANIWALFFGFDRIGVTDDFFELGGDSLKAMLISTTIRKELKVEVPGVEFFNNPTIKTLAAYINKAAKSEYYSIEPGETKEY